MACETTVEFSITVYPPAFFNGASQQILCDKDQPWNVAPENRDSRYLKGSIPAPALGVLTEIFQYLVPEGFTLVINGDMHAYSGSGFVEGSGGIIWGIDVNEPIGNTLPSGRPIAQWIASAGNLGRVVDVPPVQFRGGDLLRYKVIITDPMVGTGLPNMIHAALVGWLYPEVRAYDTSLYV